MNNLVKVLFILTATLFTVSTLFGGYSISWLVKVVPIMILIGVTFLNATEKSQKLFMLGLIFSALGDFFLDYNPVGWFVFGLGSFLVAHVFYVAALWPVGGERLGFAGLYLIIGFAVFSLIYAKLGELMVPVIIYMLVLLAMGISTLISKKSNLWLMVGGACFVASDALLAINKFYTPLPFSSILIMATYYAAQFSLTNGFTKSATRS